MRTPKRLCPASQRIYHVEIASCPLCGGELELWNTLSWQKTIQTMDGAEWIASRPSRCASETCEGHRSRWGSAEGLQRAPKYRSYGYDVIAQIGVDHQARRDTFGEIWSNLRERVAISESEVRELYHQVYLPLLACDERRSEGKLEAVIAQQGGLIVALDGLCPEGGEPQLWFLRELTSGLTLRSGWLAQQDQGAFEAFLRPLAERGWPLLGVLSDKQRGLVPAVATVFPTTPHHFCQAHYLKNLAEPLSTADQTFKVTLRKAVRTEIGGWIRREATNEATPGVLTVTGILPDEVFSPASRAETVTEEDLEEGPPAAGDMKDDASEMKDDASEVKDDTVDEASRQSGIIDNVVIDLLRRIRYLLTLEGRPPFLLAGLELYTQLQHLLATIQLLLSHRSEPRLVVIAAGLEAVLPAFAEQAHDLCQGEQWLRQIAEILDEPTDGSVSGETVAQSLNDRLEALRNLPDVSPAMDAFRRHLGTVTQSYAPGLFHCYDVPGLPRTNNDLESHFRNTISRLLRTTGQKGQCRRALQRVGAWELLPHLSNAEDALMALRSIPYADLKDERDRFRRHKQRFRMHTRSKRATARQANRLLSLWMALPPSDTA